MSIWIEGSASILTAFKASYAAANIKDGEVIGAVAWNVDGSRWFTGSQRITNGQADQLGAGQNPNIIIHTTPDFMLTWDWPNN